MCMCTWVQNYLTNRKQNVVIDYHSSDLLDVTCNMQQGFVFVPIMCIRYIGDIGDVVDVLIVSYLLTIQSHSVQK